MTFRAVSWSTICAQRVRIARRAYLPQKESRHADAARRGCAWPLSGRSSSSPGHRHAAGNPRSHPPRGCQRPAPQRTGSVRSHCGGSRFEVLRLCRLQYPLNRPAEPLGEPYKHRSCRGWPAIAQGVKTVRARPWGPPVVSNRGGSVRCIW